MGHLFPASLISSQYLVRQRKSFSNHFLTLHLTGPNTATGHASVIYTSEIQVCYCPLLHLMSPHQHEINQAKYITQLIKPILAQKVTSLEIKVDATDAYNDKIQARLSRSVFPHCNSWYRVGGEGKITNIFPG